MKGDKEKYFPYLVVAMLLYSTVAHAFENCGSHPPLGTSPTDIITRADLEYRFIDTQNDAKTHALVIRYDYAFSPNVVFRTDIPLLTADPDDNKTGMGDLFVRVGWQAVSDTQYTLFFGGDVIFDTATENSLGDGTYIASPLVATMWTLANQGAFMGFSLSQSLDIGGSNSKDINDTVLRPFYIKSLPGGAWFSLEAHLSLDWENDNAFGWFQKFQLGKMVSKNFGLTLTPGIGIIGDNHGVPDWQVNGGIRYLFGLHHKMDETLLNCTRCHYD